MLISHCFSLVWTIRLLIKESFFSLFGWTSTHSCKLCRSSAVAFGHPQQIALTCKTNLAHGLRPIFVALAPSLGLGYHLAYPIANKSNI